MILGVILLLVCFFENTKGVFLKNALKWLGGITLEIYLIHEKVLGICNGILKQVISNKVVESVAANIFAVIIAVCLAKLLNLLVDRLSKIKIPSRTMGSLL